MQKTKTRATIKTNVIPLNYIRFAHSPPPCSTKNTPHLASPRFARCRLNYKAEALFEAISGQHKIKNFGGGNVQNLSNTCWAFATVGYDADAFFKSVGDEHGHFVRDANEQEIANTLWAFAVAGKLEEGKGLVKELWKRACGGRLQLNNDSLRQFGLFYAAVQIEGPKDFDLEVSERSERALMKTSAYSRWILRNGCRHYGFIHW